MQAKPKSVQTSNTTPANQHLPRYDLNLRLASEPSRKDANVLSLHIDYRSSHPSYADESAFTVSYDVGLDEFKVLITDCEQAWRNFTRAAASADVNPITLAKLIRELIRKGRAISTVLLKADGNTDRDGERALNRLRAFLVEQPEGLRILAETQGIELPWNLMHIGDSTDHTGFLGYRHQIVQKVRINSESLDHAPVQDFCLEPPFQFSLQRNLGLDHYVGVVVADDSTRKTPAKTELEGYIGQFDAYLSTPKRDNREEFLGSLQAGAMKDDFMYFICHGNFDKQKRYYLNLTGAEDPIYAVDISDGLSTGHLLHQPLVFLNACFGAKVGTIPYADFARTFLRHGANAVIGPVLEVPAKAAVKIAKAFFHELFSGPSFARGTTLPRTISDVLFETRRQLMDQEPGPDLIPLLYSVTVRQRFRFRWEMKIAEAEVEVVLRSPWEQRTA